ncbi:conserved Plasmodium protein, unknown function [Plasmodium gallinaceum]|uniref:Uncharacterized protein n=1 Tax=Plasmodium gallinaceum TaxID=5849 RepID=A0A1J1GYC6_PLAGA|nr:conserved Plasmodium protein, unknown function [Plasmodium gallinaceum]CRG97311.1 conserved Plasmodium protein, unknown function [Plasmodium gallinaceum]
MMIFFIFRNILILYYALWSFHKIYVNCIFSNKDTLDNLDDNTLLAFFLLVQLEIPYFLENFSQKLKYEKVIDATIYIFNEEISKTEFKNEEKDYFIQDIKCTIWGNILKDIKNENKKYFTWLNLIFNECWYKEEKCEDLTSKKCTLSVLAMVPKRSLKLTCINCVIYALNYASHSKYLFKMSSQIEHCYDENNSHLINLSKDIGLIRENRIYLSSLEKISVLKNVKSEIIVLLIKNATGLINLLKTGDHGKFIRVINQSLFDVIKKSVKDYLKNLNYNNAYKSDESIMNLKMEKSLTLTVNGYLFSDKNSNKILRFYDFGLFLSGIHLKKCTSLLTKNNLIIQIEIGNIKNNTPLENGKILNLIEYELFLNSFLHFGSNYYSKVTILLKKVIYMKGNNWNDIFIYDELNQDNSIIDDSAAIISGETSETFNNLTSYSLEDHIEERKKIEEFKKNQIELMEDQTVIFIIMVNILPENKYSLLKKKIIDLLKNPVNSRSLEGFQYDNIKLISEKLIEVLGESFNDVQSNTRRRTNYFGSRINKREIESIEKLIQPGKKLVQIAFHNFTSIPLENRTKFYSANKMFSLFEHRIHYYNEWNSQILFSKKIYPEDILLTKSYNVFSYVKPNKNYWFIISLTVIPFLIILLLFGVFKYMFPKRLQFHFFSKKKTKKHKYSCLKCHKSCRDISRIRKSSYKLKKQLMNKNSYNLLKKKSKLRYMPKEKSCAKSYASKKQIRKKDIFFEDIETNNAFLK